MANIVEKKRKSYTRDHIVSNYDKRRFGGASGNYVNKVETGVFAWFLKDVNGKILDLACGTGRITERLIKDGHNVVAADYSEKMLDKLKKKVKVKTKVCDAFNLPFKRETFEAVTMGRLFQHYKDVTPFLEQAKKVVKKGGYITFDALKWSPWQIYFLFSKNDVRGIYGHSAQEMKEIAKRLDLKVEKVVSRFVVSPGLYRFLPYSLVRVMDKVERILPRFMLVRKFYLLKKE